MANPVSQNEAEENSLHHTSPRIASSIGALTRALGSPPSHQAFTHTTAQGSSRRGPRLKARRGPGGGSAGSAQAARRLRPGRGQQDPAGARWPPPVRRGKGPVPPGRPGHSASPHHPPPSPPRRGLTPGGSAVGGAGPSEGGCGGWGWGWWGAAPGLNRAQERGGDQSAH